MKKTTAIATFLVMMLFVTSVNATLSPATVTRSMDKAYIDKTNPSDSIIITINGNGDTVQISQIKETIPLGFILTLEDTPENLKMGFENTNTVYTFTMLRDISNNPLRYKLTVENIDVGIYPISGTFQDVDRNTGAVVGMGSITVSDNILFLRYDTSPQNNLIDKTEVLQAVADYFWGPNWLTFNEVISIVNKYFSGTPIVIT